MRGRRAHRPASSARGRHGPLLVTFALAALAIATYLAVVKLSGAVPACGPIHGCETVNTSRYSEFLGVPVAVFGALGSTVLTIAAFAWWRMAARPGLYVIYAFGLVALAVLAYLTYLELAVIGAVCIWCVGYAAATLCTWLTAVAALRADPHLRDRARGTSA